MIDSQTPTPGQDLIAAERQRQLSDKGYTAAHDASRWTREFTAAAAAYRDAPNAQTSISLNWPWGPAAWKPKDRLHNLVRAGALYLAAADRIESNKPGCTAALALRTEAMVVAAEIDSLIVEQETDSRREGV